MEDTGRAISRFDTGSQESNGVSAFIPPATPAVNGQHSPDFTAPAPEPEIVPLRMDEAAREEAKRVSFADIRAGGSGRAGSRGQICRNGGPTLIPGAGEPGSIMVPGAWNLMRQKAHQLHGLPGTHFVSLKHPF